MHPDRLEIELFGTERNGDGREGVSKVGFLEQAHSGTLLLDEVADMLPPDIGSAGAGGVAAADGTEVLSLPLREAREIFERKYLESQVSRFGGNISRTASFVGMERSALHRKLRSLGITGSERGDKVE
jgi:DNA-binding NtrC family response regulator